MTYAVMFPQALAVRHGEESDPAARCQTVDCALHVNTHLSNSQQSAIQQRVTVTAFGLERGEIWKRNGLIIVQQRPHEATGRVCLKGNVRS